jgi:uncharacterized protein YidB (DUF937 family)
MNVSSVSTTGVTVQPQDRAHRTPPEMTNTAQLLGMSADELRDAQRSGTTLADLATQKGVSKDDLVKSLASDLKANKPEGAPELSEAQMTEMATNIAEGKRPQGPQGPPPGGGSGGSGGDRAQANVASLAEALGTDADTLLQKLQSGEDLTTLLRGATGYGSSATVSGGLSIDRYA